MFFWRFDNGQRKLRSAWYSGLLDRTRQRDHRPGWDHALRAGVAAGSLREVAGDSVSSQVGGLVQVTAEEKNLAAVSNASAIQLGSRIIIVVWSPVLVSVELEGQRSSATPCFNLLAKPGQGAVVGHEVETVEQFEFGSSSSVPSIVWLNHSEGARRLQVKRPSKLKHLSL